MPDADAHGPAAARAFWSGVITFGLVSIPVDFFAAVHPRHTSMRMVDRRGRPLGRQYYSDTREGGLPREDIVRGYETEGGKKVVVTDEELDAIAPDMSRDIDLRLFVPQEQIRPACYQRPYFLAPAGRSYKAYGLLAQAMRESGRVGIGTFVMRGHQYLVAILSDGRLLRAETLRFAAEIRTPADVGLPRPAKRAAKGVKRFAAAIRSLERDRLDMDELSDRYAESIQALVEKKEKKHKGIVKGAEPEEEGEAPRPVADFMAMLERSLGKRPNGHARTGAAGAGRLARLSRDELYERARKLAISGRSHMDKPGLIAAIRKAA